MPKLVDQVTVSIYDDHTSTTQPIITGTQYEMDLNLPILMKETQNNTIDSASEINIDFVLSSLFEIRVYGDIEIELGSTLPQSGTVYYTVEDLSSGSKFSYYRYIVDGSFQLRYLRFVQNLLTGVKVSMRIPVSHSNQYVGNHQIHLGYNEDLHPLFSGKRHVFSHAFIGDVPYQSIQAQNYLPGNSDIIQINYTD